jgi:hypothetical protein
LEAVEGMQFDRGYVSPYFITNADKMLVELEAPYILIHEKKASGLQPMLPLLESVVQSGEPLLIIARRWWPRNRRRRLLRPRRRRTTEGEPGARETWLACPTPYEEIRHDRQVHAVEQDRPEQHQRRDEGGRAQAGAAEGIGGETTPHQRQLIAPLSAAQFPTGRTQSDLLWIKAGGSKDLAVDVKPPQRIAAGQYPITVHLSGEQGLGTDPPGPQHHRPAIGQNPSITV